MTVERVGKTTSTSVYLFIYTPLNINQLLQNGNKRNIQNSLQK